MATTATKSTAKKSTAKARTPKPKAQAGAPVQVRTKSARSSYYTPKSAAYAYLGAADLAIEKTLDASGRFISTLRDLRNPSEVTANVVGVYDKAFQDLSARGEKLARSIQASAYTRRALDQTKVAQRQFKAATESVRKAVETAVETATTATLEAAKKVS
jgi:hypothetical protein